jgi:quinol-cytochrome oxidoreductase complex cytochrome b subunit
VLVGAMAIPYIDRDPETRPSERKTVVVLFTLVCILGLALTFVGIVFRGPAYTLYNPFDPTTDNFLKFYFSL